MVDFPAHASQSDVATSTMLSGPKLNDRPRGHQVQLARPVGSLDGILVAAFGRTCLATQIPLLMATAPEEFDASGAS